MAENVEMVDSKYGEPLRYDRNFQGPRQRNRSCTDVPCLILFALFLGGWVFIARYAINNGDLDKLMVPTDTFNQKCGIDSNVLNKKYLFFFNLEECIDPLVPITGCKTPQICVESCPTQTFDWETMNKNGLTIAQLKSPLICKTEKDKAALHSRADIDKAVRDGRCARHYIKSQPIFNRCMFEISDQLCRRSPSYRTRRDSEQLQLTHNVSQSKKLVMPAMALTLQSEAQARVAVSPSQVAPVNDKGDQCLQQQHDGEVIQKKMMQTNTQLAKMVGNLVTRFYNGTADVQRLGEEIVDDLVNSLTVVIVALCITLIASLVFITLMRWLAAPIVWFSIIGVLIGLLVGIYYSFKQYTYWNNTPTVPQHDLNLFKQIENLLQNPTFWLCLSIALCIFFLTIFLLVIVLRKRIQIAISLIKEGSKAVSTVISTVFFPIFSWVLLIAAIGFAVVVGLYLGSIGSLSFRMVRRLDKPFELNNENCICQGPAINYTIGNACDPQIFHDYCRTSNGHCVDTSCSFLKLDNPTYIRWAIAYDIFGFFWLSFFITAFSDMVLAATFARWYWTFKKRDVPYFTLSHAFVQTAFYHLGTLAFGSLILAICRMIRLVLEYIDRKLKKYDNVVTRAILCCMRCFFWLLESFLRFLNKNAYIMCAIHGKNFCTSAKDAFSLLMRNCLRVVALDKVTDFLFFLSKLLLTGGAGVATYYFLANNPHVIQLNHKAVPTTVVVIAAFLITSVFFGVYSMAVDTLFLCFLEDCERNDGTPEKPYFMSKQLMKILGKKNKLPPRQRRSK
ncbi:choline transporter-like 2 [Drosophila grimshawi]|uniref:Choline transporter-like protein n=1 Tax=Drosophila grimshawi TaxID=7222 RepID=B4JRR0_DROGR|nr:choline transporter-like 2 [Drosophila grimshawi]EDV94450.1 GH19659 [Drosophila grimshawi]